MLIDKNKVPTAIEKHLFEKHPYFEGWPINVKVDETISEKAKYLSQEILDYIKVGDKIIFHDSCPFVLIVTSTNVVDLVNEIVDFYKKPLTGSQRYDMRLFIYILISECLDSDKRVELINKFEDGGPVSIYDFMGDVQGLEGYRYVSQGVWKLILRDSYTGVDGENDKYIIMKKLMRGKTFGEGFCL